MKLLLLNLYYLLFGLTSVYSFDVDRNHLNLIIGVQRYYQARNIYFVHDVFKENHNSKMFNYARDLSAKGIYSQVIDLFRLKEKYSSIVPKAARELIVVHIDSNTCLSEFEKFTKTHSLLKHVWFIIFSLPQFNVCDNHTGNRFHLSIDTQMLVKCSNSASIEEWYALSPRHDIIVNHLFEWYGNKSLERKIKDGWIKRRSDFQGRVLRVSFIEEYDGPRTFDLVDRVAMQMLSPLKISIRLLKPRKYCGIYNESEGKWNGLIGDLSSGGVDISFTEFIVTRNNFEAVDFTWPIFHTEIGLFFKDPEQFNPKWIAYSGHVIELSAKIAILCLLILTTLIMTISKAKSNNSTVRSNSFDENLFYVWGMNCQQGLPEFPKENPLRITVVSTHLASMMMSWICVAFIISELATNQRCLPFSTLDEFAEIGSHKLVVVKNSVDEEYFSADFPQPQAKKFRKLMPLHEDLPSTYIEAFNQACDERVAIFAGYGLIAKYRQHVKCELSFVSTGGSRYASIALSKSYPIKRFLNHYIMKFRYFGLIRRLMVKSRPQIKFPESFVAIGLNEIFPPLVVLFASYIISVVVLLCELFHRYVCKWKRRGRRRLVRC